MAYNGRSSFKLNRALALVEGFTAQTLSGDTTLTVKDSQFQAIDPGGAGRNVTLPAGDVRGRFMFIANKADADEGIVLLQPNGSTVAATVSQNDMAIIYATDDIADGASSGWSLFFMVSGAIT
tara:strand:+ start:152 stop:520 length:369 start_codon:yes stop_codon:yes gene_type:complete